MSTARPAWWPTEEQKRHADAGCSHPDECRVGNPPVRYCAGCNELESSPYAKHCCTPDNMIEA